MAVMNGDDRRQLVFDLSVWLENAEAGVQCTNDVTPGIIALIKRPSDNPSPPGPP